MSERGADPVDAELVMERLRRVSCPGFGGDIVSQGFVREIEVGAAGCLTVRLAPDSRCGEQVDAMVEAIRAELGDLHGVSQIRVERVWPFAGVVAAGASDERAILEALDGPVFEAVGKSATDVSVFQWEIDPNDSKCDNGDCELGIDGWDYRVWWQVHPLGLVYASVQSVRDETGEVPPTPRRPPASGVVVNVVYDLERDGIAAIYGNAGDFRPFVEAFRRAYGI